MARRPRRRDWQERAYEEGELQRRDRSVGVPGDLPNPYKLSADLPRRSVWRWTAGGLGVLVVAALIRGGLDSRAPSLTTSCATPAFALSSSDPHTESVVRWAATGPSATRFIITIGIARLVPGTKPGQVHAVPEPGGSAATTEVAVLATSFPSSCKANGAFRVGVPAGRYPVRMFTLTGTASDVTATDVATKELTVSS
jgi:hypothetical protein